MRQLATIAVAPARALIPLRGRLALVRWLGRNPRIPYRDVLSLELARDFLERNPDRAHRFMWAHHLAYAESYEVAARFGGEHIDGSRHLLFADLAAYLDSAGINPSTDIESLLEVGSSLGFLLRHLEVTAFTGATSIQGLDIDAYAVDRGNRYLREIGSIVQLQTGDVTTLRTHLAGRSVDVILCLGVLLYLPESAAAELVSTIVQHAAVVAVFADVAHPELDNVMLRESTRRKRDSTFVHNIDRMVMRAGGEVVSRRFDPRGGAGGYPPYFVLATRTDPSNSGGSLRRGQRRPRSSDSRSPSPSG